ncbi:hypothetical protein BAE44_0015284, partial [Dichanthelium oligosanthes]
LLPIPPGLTFSDREVVLLRRRDQDAVLLRGIDYQDNDKRFDLHLYNSKTGRWNTRLMHVDSPKSFSYSYPSIVLAIGGWVAATKKMKISDISSGKNNWEEDCSLKFSEIPVDSTKSAQMLPNLKRLTTDTKLTLKRLHAGYPALSLHDTDVVYIMHTPDPDKDKASVVAVDIRNKALKDVADFGSGRPLVTLSPTFKVGSPST